MRNRIVDRIIPVYLIKLLILIQYVNPHFQRNSAAIFLRFRNSENSTFAECGIEQFQPIMPSVNWIMSGLMYNFIYSLVVQVDKMTRNSPCNCRKLPTVTKQRNQILQSNQTQWRGGGFHTLSPRRFVSVKKSQLIHKNVLRNSATFLAAPLHARGKFTKAEFRNSSAVAECRRCEVFDRNQTSQRQCVTPPPSSPLGLDWIVELVFSFPLCRQFSATYNIVLIEFYCHLLSLFIPKLYASIEDNSYSIF